MIKRFVSFTVRHPILTILAIGAFTVFFAFQIWNPWMAARCLGSGFQNETACWWSWKLKMVVDPKTILPQDHPYVQLNDRIEQTFGGSRVVVIGVEAQNGDVFNPRTLSAIQALNEGVKKIPSVKTENVVSIVDRKIKHIQTQDGTIVVERLMGKIPESPQEMEQFRQRVMSNDLYLGSLISEDGTAAAIITDFRDWVPAYEESTSMSDDPWPGAEGASDPQLSGEWQGDGTGKQWPQSASQPSSGQPAGGSGKDPPAVGVEVQTPEAVQSPGDFQETGTSDGESSAGSTGSWPQAGDSADAGTEGEANPWWSGESDSDSGTEGEANPWWSGESDSDWAGGTGSGGFRMSDTAIYEAIQEISDPYRDEELAIHIGGLPVALAFMEKDSARIAFLFPLALLIMLVILYLAFRSFQGMLLPILTALLSVLWALGLMGLMQIPMDPFNTLTPILILAVAAGHSIQILKRYYEELAVTGDNRTAIIQATTKIAPVTITAALIAAASFSSLMAFEIKTFQTFGLLTAFGILSALVLELTFIPALRSILRAPAVPGKQSTETGFLDRGLHAIACLVTGPHKIRIALLCGVIVAVALFGTARVEVDNSLKSQFFESTRLRIDEAALNHHFSGTSTFYIFLEGNQPGALKDPEVLAAVDDLQRRMEALPEVGKTESFVDYIKKMNRTFHGGEAEFDRVPGSRQQISDFLFLYSISGNPADFARLVDYDYRQAVIWSYLKTDSTALAEQLIDLVEDFALEYPALFTMGLSTEPVAGLSTGFVAQPIGMAEAPTSPVLLGVAGSAPVTVALNRTMVEGKIQNMMQIVAIIFLASSLVLRSFVGGLMVLLPLSLAVLINFGVMGLTGITLGIGTAAISAMAVGIGADYAIYLLFRIREEYRELSGTDGADALREALHRAIRTSGKAIVFVALSISAGYAILPYSGYYLHMEGILVPLAMITSCLGALVLLSVLVSAFKPRFITIRR